MSALLRRFQKQEEKSEKSHLLGPNNHKLIIIGNKGLRHDHICLLEDFLSLVPHAKKGSTLPSNEIKYIDEIATDRHCDTAAFFETRHRGESRECYFWLSRVPEGPSFNFYVDEIESIKDLETIGVCMKGSRPLLFFDPALDQSEHLQMAKHLLKRFFSVPHENKHAKPFVDRAMSFILENGLIVMRHYQVQWLEDESINLVEVGPRARLIPNFILAGAFKGSKIWKNETFVSPYKVEKEKRRQKAQERLKTRDRQAIKEERRQNIPEIEDPMKGLFDEAPKENAGTNDEKE